MCNEIRYDLRRWDVIQRSKVIITTPNRVPLIVLGVDGYSYNLFNSLNLAETAIPLKPVFPSKTFPNFYSIATVSQLEKYKTNVKNAAETSSQFLLIFSLTGAVPNTTWDNQQQVHKQEKG